MWRLKDNLTFRQDKDGSYGGNLLAKERASLEHGVVGVGGGLRVLGPAVNVNPGI